MDWRHRNRNRPPAIHHGDPCIKHTRVPVSVIVGSIADGEHCFAEKYLNKAE